MCETLGRTQRTKQRACIAWEVTDDAAFYSSIVFALAQSWLLFHLGDLLLTFSASLVKHILYVCILHCTLQNIPAELQKWTHFSQHCNSMETHTYKSSSNSNSSSNKKEEEKKQRPKHLSHQPRLVKWIHILFLLSFIVIQRRLFVCLTRKNTFT